MRLMSHRLAHKSLRFGRCFMVSEACLLLSLAGHPCRFRDDAMAKLLQHGASVPLIASNGQRVGAL